MEENDKSAKLFDTNEKEPFKMTKNQIMILIAIVAIVICLAEGVILNKKIKSAYQNGYLDGETKEIVVSDSITVSETSLLQAMAPIAELATYEYAYANWDTYEKDKLLFNKIKVPFINDKTIFAYSGKITVGIKNAKDVRIEIDNGNKKIHVYIPEPVILHNEISKDNFKTFDYKDSIFVSTGLAEYHDFEEALKKKEEEELEKKKEFWDSARGNTENMIRALLSPFLPSDYVVEANWNK